MADPIDFDERLDAGHIRAAALHAAEALWTCGTARLRITPGEGSAYDLVVIAPGPVWHKPGEVGPREDEYLVALVNTYGKAHPWAGPDGNPVVPHYAADCWVQRSAGAGIRLWAGEVLSRFLTALSEAMGES